MDKCKTQVECESPISCEKSGRCWRASKDKPHLLYVACHRGVDAGLVSVGPRSTRRIARGPLKGCHHKPDAKSIFKVGPGYVLEFHRAIRVRI